MPQEINTQFDAIVIGAGMSGAWAAKEFATKGLKTLLLERGPDVKHIVDYPTTGMQPWEFKHRGSIPASVREANPVVSRCYAFREDAAHFFVKDQEHPYEQVKPFDWIRGYQVGGKSIMWARQVQRWSDYDFEGPQRDGFAVDWPIRYQDIEDWYSYVERYIGVSGNYDGLKTLPDGVFQPAWDLNCVEKHFQSAIDENYEDRHFIYGRVAHVTELTEEIKAQGRTLCQGRNICQRGCPYGGYFNVNSSLIPQAQNTGNLTLRPHSVVDQIIYDEDQGKAVGVRVIDAQNKEVLTFKAEVIFLNAATINSNCILLNSTSDRFPNGLGNDSGTLGKYLGFHNYRGRIQAKHGGHEDVVYKGGRPTAGYIPRFRNIEEQETDFLRGYAVAFYSSRSLNIDSNGFGQELQDNLLSSKSYGPWSVSCLILGETIPQESNQISLDRSTLDEFGIPKPQIDISYTENDEKMLEDFYTELSKMFEQAGFTDLQRVDTKQAPGLDIHEMGGIRMGKDPKTSMLNKWNQLHACPNVYVSDGSCMTSISTQNPSLTFMALTARAANHAIEGFDNGKYQRLNLE